MTIRNEITSSQIAREEEIQNFWLVYEPISNTKLNLKYKLYSSPIGQTFLPTLNLLSGAYETLNEEIRVRKDIHLFESEQEASKFITEIGTKNISFIQTKVVDGKSLIEIHLINHVILNFKVEINDFEETKGYKIEVFRSGSQGLEEIPRRNINNDSFHDTYIKYFDIQTDKQ